MAEYWFKPNDTATARPRRQWQGWAFTVGTVLAMVAVSLYLRLTAKSLWALVALLMFDAAAVAALVVVSYRKTDGGWLWRWGDR